MSFTEYPSTYQPEGPPPGLRVTLPSRPKTDSISKTSMVGSFELRNQGPFLIEVSPSEGDSEHLQENYKLVMARLEELVTEIISWADNIRQKYEVSVEPYYHDAKLEVTLPNEKLGPTTEWSVWLHDGLSGWLVDLNGERPIGGQGVF